MKPIYFPFTYISTSVARALHACLGKTIVYQPLKKYLPEDIQNLAQQDVVDIRFPVKLENKDEKNLAAILKEYGAWRNLHQGGRGLHPDFFKVMRNKIPFFDDTSASQIKADIKNISGVNSNKKEPDPVFNAQIFLSLAQKFDRQNEKIVQDLASYETARMDLIKNLRAEDETSPVVPGYQDEFRSGNLADSDHMIPERMEAWTLLMGCDPVQRRDEISGFFVTNSRQTIDYVLEKAPETKKILAIDSIPMEENSVDKMATCSKELMKNLKIVAESPMPLDHDPFVVFPENFKFEKKVSLSIYLVPGVSPLEYFSRFLSFDSAQSGITKNRVKLKNTLIGYIGFSD